MYSKQITATFKNIILFCRDVEKTAGFYSDAVGLKVSHQSKQLVELKDYSNFRLILKQIDGEAYNMKGYSPVLNFEVDDFEHTLKKFQSYGAEKDGEIVDNEDYQMGFFKSPNGEMISIIKTKTQINSDDDGEGVEETKTQQEIKNILKKIQF
ncbi:hypothetical protein ABPG74_018992 [Tetrahymena malaccensis]